MGKQIGSILSKTGFNCSLPLNSMFKTDWDLKVTLSFMCG